MDRVRSMMENLEVSGSYDRKLAAEIRELEKRRTAIMMEKCLGMNGSVMCPKPRKRHGRHEDSEIRVAADLSDYIISKASPPYYSGSPPIRSSNPLVQDANFRDGMSTQALVFHCSAQ